MEHLDLLGILWTLLLVLSNALAAILWGKIKKLEKDVERLEADMYNLKFNYLSRFDDIKKHLNDMNLELITKMTILQTKIEAGFLAAINDNKPKGQTIHE